MKRIVMAIVVVMGMAACKTAPPKPEPLVDVKESQCQKSEDGRFEVCVQTYNVKGDYIVFQGGFTEDGKGVIMAFGRQLQQEPKQDGDAGQPGLKILP